MMSPSSAAGLDLAKEVARSTGMMLGAPMGRPGSNAKKPRWIAPAGLRLFVCFDLALADLMPGGLSNVGSFVPAR